MNVRVKIGTAVYLLNEARVALKPLENRNFFFGFFSQMRRERVEIVIKVVAKMSLNKTKLKSG
jgi:hypothetical protein